MKRIVIIIYSALIFPLNTLRNPFTYPAQPTPQQIPRDKPFIIVGVVACKDKTCCGVVIEQEGFQRTLCVGDMLNKARVTCITCTSIELKHPDGQVQRLTLQR